MNTEKQHRNGKHLNSAKINEKINYFFLAMEINLIFNILFLFLDNIKEHIYFCYRVSNGTYTK